MALPDLPESELEDIDFDYQLPPRSPVGNSLVFDDVEEHPVDDEDDYDPQLERDDDY